MSYAVITNVFTMLLCGAVLIQSARLMRNLKALREAGLRDMVDSLDRSTAEARGVLGRLKEVLSHELAESNRTVAEGLEMREELTIMVGIANAVAERIVEAANVTARAALPEVAGEEEMIP
ncbi:hypothetical protein [Iodidimonas sp. SYSU 1G8]|uniref:hypothetical protein n=1 Tax=Iodidimonas sp. SYSU 1G8 TaxID=3133967 RepID=UPI0031FF0AAE